MSGNERQGPVRLRRPGGRRARARRVRRRPRRRRTRRLRSRPRRASAVRSHRRLPLTPPCRRLRETLRPCILYSKGDVAGLAALAAAATDPDERSALEWAALRADAASVLRLARRLPCGSPELAKPRLDPRAAGSRTRRASAGAGDGRRIFRGRPAAVERGQDRRGAGGAGDGPRRGGGANHPRLVARRQFRRAGRRA